MSTLCLTQAIRLRDDDLILGEGAEGEAAAAAAAAAAAGEEGAAAIPDIEE